MVVLYLAWRSCKKIFVIRRPMTTVCCTCIAPECIWVYTWRKSTMSEYYGRPKVWWVGSQWLEPTSIKFLGEIIPWVSSLLARIMPYPNKSYRPFMHLCIRWSFTRSIFYVTGRHSITATDTVCVTSFNLDDRCPSGNSQHYRFQKVYAIACLSVLCLFALPHPLNRWHSTDLV